MLTGVKSLQGGNSSRYDWSTSSAMVGFKRSVVKTQLAGVRGLRRTKAVHTQRGDQIFLDDMGDDGSISSDSGVLGLHELFWLSTMTPIQRVTPQQWNTYVADSLAERNSVVGEVLQLIEVDRVENDNIINCETNLKSAKADAISQEGWTCITAGRRNSEHAFLELFAANISQRR